MVICTFSVLTAAYPYGPTPYPVTHEHHGLEELFQSGNYHQPNEDDGYEHHHSHHHQSNGPKSYHYEYAVHDPVTGDEKCQNEVSDEHGTVKGTYSLVEPDGSIRVVEYTADDEHGFNAVVKKIAPKNKPISVSPEYKFPVTSEHKFPTTPEYKFSDSPAYTLTNSHDLSDSPDYKLSDTSEHKFSNSLIYTTLSNNSPEHKLSDSSSHKFPDSPNHDISEFPEHQYSDSPDHKFSGSSDHKFTGSSEHKLTDSPEHEAPIEEKK